MQPRVVLSKRRPLLSGSLTLPPPVPSPALSVTYVSPLGLDRLALGIPARVRGRERAPPSPSWTHQPAGCR